MSKLYDYLVDATAHEQEKVFSPILEAHGTVHGARQDVYGTPAENLEHTAGLWRAQFGWDVSAGDVAVAQALVKLSRLRRSPDHRDSVVDWAGYAECYWLTR